MGIRLQIVTRSLWVVPVCAGGCNGCHLEILACLSPPYDLERFGVRVADSPESADGLLVSGSPGPHAARALRRALESLPGPVVTVAVGTCALAQGIFSESPAGLKPVDAVVPVQLHIPGCPPAPEAVIAGLGKLVKLIRRNPEP